MPDTAERQQRIRDLRQYGTTEDAENTALDLLATLPAELPRIGIFASFDDVEDERTGTGGIHFQYVDADTIATVGITPGGTFEDCYAVKGNEVIEAVPSTAKEAADFLIYTNGAPHA